MVGSDHEDDLRIIINLKKKPPGPDSIPPCLRVEVFKFFDVWPEVGVLHQLGMHVFLKFPNHFALTGFCDLGKVLLKLLGLKYPIFIQRSGPFSLWLPWSPA